MSNIKKILSAIAITSVLLVPTAITAGAYSNSPSGSATGLTFDGTGWTVAMINCKMKDAMGSVSIDDFGSGKGKIKYGAYCSTGNSVVEHYYTFSEAASHEFYTQSSGIWGVDGINTSLSKKRTGVNVSWDLV